MGYSSFHKDYKCLSSTGRIYISKDVLFNELRFPYLDLFPLSSSPVQNTNSYLSLNLDLSPPFVAPTPPLSQLPSSHSPSAPSIPPGFSSASNQPSSESTSAHPRSSNIGSHSESIPASTSVPTNTRPMQTRSKSGIHNPRLHPSLFLTHSKPKNVKQALKIQNGLQLCKRSIMLY